MTNGEKMKEIFQDFNLLSKDWWNAEYKGRSSMEIETIANKYKKVAMDLLAEYLENEQSVISEFSGDFEKSAIVLKKRVMKYLERLDEGEDTFNEIVKDMWIADYYKAESEV